MRFSPLNPVGPIALLGGGNVDYRAGGRGRWYKLPLLPEALDVELDGLADQLQGFLSSLANGDATGEVRHVRAVRRGSLLDDYEIPHTPSPTS